MSAKKNNRRLPQARSRLKIESLEPRLLFSADLPAWHSEIDSSLPYSEQLSELVSSHDQSANEAVTQLNTATTVVIIDPATPDYQTLVDDIKKQNNSVAVYLLDADTDGLAQITLLLASHSNIESLQIISHGNDGELDLGSTSINSNTLLLRADEISQWRDKFSSDADILIYGCDLAATEAGEQFVSVLGYLTSTDVAASENKTGSTLNGADWTLEYRTGSIESTLAVSQQLQNNYKGVLATVTVTTTLDTNHSGIVAGNALHTVAWLTSQPVAGEISLREAIIAANNTNNGTTTINLGAGTYSLDLTGSDDNVSATGDLDINSDIIINGSGVESTVISGNNTSRVFELRNNSALTINDMQITDGNSLNANGGAVLVGGGATLQTYNVEFFANVGSDGGAIANVGGHLDINDTSFRLNEADDGGAIFIANGTIDLKNSTLEQNTAASRGGGLHSSQSTADTIITNVTMSGNSAGVSGGALSLNGATIINSTIVNNVADTTGGIRASSPLILQNVIAANNTSSNASTADFSGSVAGAPIATGNVIENTTATGLVSGVDNNLIGVAPTLGALQDNGGPTKTHALLAGSVGINASIAPDAPPNDQRGVAREGAADSGSFEYIPLPNSVPTLDTSAQFSVEEGYSGALPVTITDADGDTLTYSLIGLGDNTLFNIDPVSGELTFINPPDFEAPADTDSNNVYNITLTADDGNGGVLSQSLDVTVTDIVEFHDITVTTTSDANINGIDANNPLHTIDWLKAQTGDVSLREAIIASNNTNSGTTTITMGPGTHLIQMNGADGETSALGDLDIHSDIVIVGTGITDTVIDGDGLSRIFDVRAGGSLTLSDMTVTNGEAGFQAGGAVLINSGGALTAESVVFSNSSARNGGAISNAGTLQLTDITIIGNSGTNGGGLHNIGAATLTRVTVNNNTATEQGAGIHSIASISLIVSNSTISNNTSDWLGGGMHLGTATIINTTITQNTAEQGGGIFSGANVNLKNVISAGNTSTDPADSARSDFRGTAATQGGNVIENTVAVGFNTSIDSIGVAPLLGALQDNGGVTQTHELLAGSVGVDLGIAAGAPITDQRGEARQGVLDSGSTEFITSNAPTLSTPAQFSVPETYSQALPVTVTDPDGDTLTYSLSGNVDDALFSIDSVSGEITFNTPPDFEAPVDADANNIYNITLTADDLKGGVLVQALEVNVTDAVHTLVVTTLSDNIDGDITNVESLVASKGVDGHISLREAITAANSSAEHVSITFDISDATVGGVHRLMILEELPAISASVTIDGTTDSDYVDSPVIVLDGASMPLATVAHGLQLNGVTTAEIRGLGVVNFDATAIYISNSTDINVAGNYIGTVGATAESNAIGVVISSSTGVQIGGNTDADRNVISGNTTHGIHIRDSGSTNNFVQGNYIGTDKTGLLAIANGEGITVSGGANGNTIGGDGANEGNIISGNSNDGITLVDSGTNSNIIQSNYIGVDVSGNIDLGNGNNGIAINGGAQSTTIGGNAATEGNVISGNGTSGITIDGENLAATSLNAVQGNFIGTNFDGTQRLSNDDNGITIKAGALDNIIGSSNATERNIISGNSGHGVSIQNATSNNNQIIGNYIGTDVAGTSDLGNGLSGIFISAANNTIIGSATGASGNLISGNDNRGIYITGTTAAVASGTVIQSNQIGTDISGTVDIGNNGAGILMLGNVTNTMVGGDTGVLNGNTISGNNSQGILISGTNVANNTFAGNIIGLTSDGTARLQNEGHGIQIDDGAHDNNIGTGILGHTNTISGNRLSGINLVDSTTVGNKILGNYIGTDTTGLIALGNLRDGLYIEQGANANQIGDIGLGANVISGNGESGIQLEGERFGTFYDTDNNIIIGNFIGTDATGNQALGNVEDGITITGGVAGTQIGGTLVGQGNLISGNANGIAIEESSDNDILGNNIGTNLFGDAAVANTFNGIQIAQSSSSNHVGDGTAAGANVIAGNTEHGVHIAGANTNLNGVNYNYIGIDRVGSLAIANGESGVALTGGAIGTVVDSNVISGNAKYGVLISGAQTSTNTVSNNLIGTDNSGSSSVGNLQSGIRIDTGASNNLIGGDRTAGEGNTISGNGSHGILLIDTTTSNNTISGNMIGTDVTGTVSLQNATHGIVISDAANNTIGGTTPGEINVISGNTGSGIVIQGVASSGSLIQGNHIGTNLAGTAAIANGQQGIFLTSNAGNILIGGSTPNESNLISGNASFGIFASGTDGLAIQGNKIGTDVLGTSAIGNTSGGIQITGNATNTTIGVGIADAATTGNVISGNNGEGVLVNTTATDNLIAGNLIGLSVGGLAALGNASHGVIMNGSNNVVGGSNVNQRNLIGSNTGNGILLSAAGTGNRVLGNSIGIAADGSDVGNTEHGIVITGSGNTIGGTLAADKNIITNNQQAGIAVISNVQDNAFLGNLVYANQDLAIDLSYDGVTLNDNGNLDADTGPNLKQNFPVINQAALVGTNTVQVEGALYSTPNSTFRIEVFVNGSSHPSGHGEAEEFLGAFTVTTDANGVANYSEALSSATNPIVGNYVSATATVETGTGFESSSELGLSVVIAGNYIPTTSGIPDITVDEDAPAPTVDLNNYFTDVDNNGVSLIYTLDTVSNPTLLQSPTISGAGILTLPLTTDGNGVTDITITATDSNSANVQSTFTLTVNPINDAPVITSSGYYLFAENNAALGTVTVDDVDGNAPIFSILAGDDANQFTIDAATGDLSFVTAADAENPSDIGADNEYQLTVNVFDGADNAQQVITVSVIDVNEGAIGPIIDQDPTANEVAEGASAGSLVGLDAGASDPDITASVEYSLDNNAGGLFVINQTTGVVTVAAGAVLDREVATDHTISVVALSTDGSNSQRTFNIVVTDINDNPPIILAGQVFSVDENSANNTIIGTAAGSDLDSSSVLQSWQIVSGDDPFGVFEIDATTGEIFIANINFLDFELKQTYTLGISVTDGNYTAVENVVVNVLDVNEQPTFANISNSSVAEGNTYTQLIQLTDPEGDPITITADISLPTWLNLVDHGDGTATLSGVPTIVDIGPNSVVIAASDGVNSADPLSFTVTVNEVEHAPTIAFTAVHTVSEPTQLIGTVVGSDLNNDTLTYSLAPTGDASAFTIDAVTGDLSFLAPTDAENPLDSNTDNIYQIMVQVSDGTTMVGQLASVQVQDVNEFFVTAVVDQDTAANAVSEGASAGTLTGIQANATDLDISDSVQFSLSNDAGGLFTIDPSTGVVTVAAAAVLDRETTSNHTISVVALSSDGSNSQQTFNIVVTDVNDNPPVITPGQSFDVYEHTPNSTIIGTVVGTDPDSSSVLQNWAINSGNALGAFSINADTGEITVVDASLLNFEPSQTLTIGLSVSDGSHFVGIVNVSINLIAVNDQPVITPIASSSLSEGDTYTQVIEVTDPENAPLVITAPSLPAWLTLTDNGDGTALLSGTPIDGDVGPHAIVIAASDGVNSADPLSFTITVVDVEHAPNIAFAAVHTVSEPTQLVGTVIGSDLDNDTLTYSLAPTGDASAFTIDAVTGALSFLAPSDAENPLDADTNNIYSITVQVSDATATTEQAVTIEVLDINESAVSAITDADAVADEVSEGSSAGTFTGITASANDPDISDSVQFSLSNDAGGLFTIDPTTGVVTVAAAAVLDRETATNHTISVVALSSDGSNSQQTFNIVVTDVNDNPPLIPAGQSFNVNENTAALTVVGNVIGTDADSSSVLQNWTIETGDPDDVFTIDAATGEIAVNNAALLDFELTPTFALGISVTDGTSTSATVAVVINVVNTNEQPTFINVAPSSVAEGDTYTQIIQVTDPEGDAIQITAPTLPAWITFTDNGDGTALLVGVPSDADVGLETVVLSANDGINNADPLTFNITVSDVTHAPTISFPSLLTPSEPTQALGQVVGADLDNDTLTYSLAPTGDASAFTIDAVTGALSFLAPSDAENPLDADTNNIYSITVQVSDGLYITEQAVTIELQNVNEDPVSTITDVNVSANAIIEDATSGSAVGIIAAANDPDISDSIDFTLDNDAGGLFTIDQTTGVVTLAVGAILDRETSANHIIEIRVTSTDGSFSVQTYSIDILDANDNAPVVQTAQIYSVVENANNADPIATVLATDADSSSQLQQWSINSGNTATVFQIDIDTGELSVNDATQLDFETTPQYVLGVSVTDGISTSIIENVVINVLDADEPPTFITAPVTTATEDVLYSHVIESIDPEGTPVEITASLLPSWLTLTTNFDNTAILSGTPTNADVGTHNIVLESNDGSLASAPLNFTIDVTNANDLPVINFPTSISMDENIAAVGTVTSTDVDGDTPTYSLANTDDASLFNIDTATGELSFVIAPDAENPLDIGANGIYNITVQVSDGSVSPVSQSVEIIIADVNETDVTGVTDQNNAINQISENSVIGSTIGITAQASDQDLNDTVTYSLDTNANNSFAIDAVSGVVTTAAILDFETNASHELIVRATSSDGSFSVQTLTVVISDINDNAPNVLAAQTFSISENTAPNTLVGNLLASDADTVGALQNWQIVSGNEDSVFTLHPTTGELGLDANAALDFELTQQYTLNVSVSDGINNSTMTEVLINVLNANEAPQFTSANTAVATELSAFNFTVTAADVDSGDSLSITASSLPSWLSLSATPGTGTATLSGTPNNADVGTHVIMLEVTDAAGTSTTQSFSLLVQDINQNPVITSSAPTTATEDTLFSHVFTASDPDSDALSFTSASLPAWLTLADNGDGTATIQGTPTNDNVGIHSFVIDLDDGGLVDSQVINIEVINVNDLPDIAFPDVISIDENTTLVGTVASNDVDSATPIYSLASTGDNLLFSIDAATGELSAIAAPDAENAADANTDNSYEITVQVSDGSPALVSQDVQITVLDVNEFGVSNVVDSNVNADAIIENSASGTLAGITASANDEDISDSVSYSLLQNSNGLFAINASSGEISLSSTASVDYEQTQSHTVVVQATSSDGSISTQSIDIAVSDANDNAPVIAPTQPLTILESASAGLSISTITANDIDTIGTQQNWAIVGGNESGIFTIDPLTGELSATDTTALNFEQTQQYALQVQVSDGIQSATQVIEIEVLDVNEPPVINNTQHTSVVGFTGQIGSIEVADPETAEIASFTIVGGTGQAAFEFGEGDQIVQTTSMPPGIYTLDVIVTDAGGISTEATLEIKVIADDGIPQLGGAEPTTTAITETTATTTTGNESKPDTVVTQEVTEPEQISEVASPEAAAEPEVAGIVGSSVNTETSFAIADTRFEGSQARQEVQHHISDNTDRSRQTNGGKSLVSASTVAMEILIQNSENLMQGFDINLDSINISTTLTPALLNAISDMNSDVNSAAKKSEIQLELAIKTGTVVSVTLTVGFITWLMQTGAFLTTALSTAPLWRSLDPIPVLISSDEDEDDDMEQFDD